MNIKNLSIKLQQFFSLQQLLIIATILFLLSGCAKSKLEEINLQNSEHVSKPFKQKKIESAYLIAFYDLTEEKIDPNYLFNKKYASLINDDNYLFQYAEKVKNKTFTLKQINESAKKRVQHLLDHVYNMKKKYSNIPTPPLFLRIKMKLGIGNDLDYLSVLDQYYSNLPLLIPEEQAYITSKFGPRCRTVTTKSTKIIKSKKSKKKSNKNKHTSTKQIIKTNRVCKIHHGFDIKSLDTDIYASGSGIVSIYRAHDFGNNIVIDHGHNIKTRYAHLAKVFVKNGEQVARGQKIGVQGNSGRSSGPHLHFEIIINNTRINPEEFIKFSNILNMRP